MIDGLDIFEETLTSNTEEKRREEEERRKSKWGIKTLPSSAPSVERTVIQELAFPVTAEDASSARFYTLTRPMDANI